MTTHQTNAPTATTPPNGSVHVAVESPSHRSGASALWLILGAVLAALAIFWLLAGGVDEAAEGAAATAVIVTEGVEDTASGAAAVATEGAAAVEAAD